MIYKVLADITVLVHSLWVGFIIFGALWGRRNRTVRIVHLSGIGLAVLLNLIGIYCPLTYLEVWLRQRHSPSLGYPGSFVAHYLEELIYVQLSMRVILVLTVLLLTVTLWVYFGRGSGKAKSENRAR
jgi:hypothetical protein